MSKSSSVPLSVLPLKKWIILVFTLAFVLRLVFSFYLSKFYYGDLTYTFGDTESFTLPFLNLISKGVYTFDFTNVDAYLYRPPAYPLFWGLHYLLFGADAVYKSVAFTQSFLDSVSSVICILLASRLGCSKKWAIFAGALYAINPILLIHVPITGTETFAILLTLSSVYLALNPQKNVNLFFSALLLALATMTRQYLGILLPLGIIYIFIWSISIRQSGYLHAARKIVVFVLSFCLFVSPWFLRNSIELGKPTILMGETTGYETYQEDYIAFKEFYTLYFVNITPIYYSVSYSGADEVSDFGQFGDLAEEVRAASQLAGSCGPSFIAVRSSRSQGVVSPINGKLCKDEVVKAFSALRSRALSSGGPILFLKTPVSNVYKSVFKQELVYAQSNPVKALAIRSIFLLRSSYIVLGLFSVFWLWKRPESVYLLFPLAIILLISFYLRQVEIRYLAQAEALLIPYAAYSANRIVSSLRSKAFAG